MKSGRPKFSVVIPTCGRESLLDCLRALAGQSYSDFEVVAVDDGSPKPVASMAGIREIPVELRILLQENAGPSAARNAGAAEARGEFLAFTDDDCIPDPAWLETLAREFEKAPASLCGTLTFNGLPRELWTATSQFIIDLVYAHFNRDPGQAYFLASNNIACRRDLFLGLGGFDTSFPKAGAEDREFCDRWRMSGNPLRLVQKPLLQHRHSQSLAKFVDLHMRYGRGAFRYQAIRRARGSGTMKQDAAFHTSLPMLLRTLLPRQGGIGRQAGILFGLLLWQIINTLGFAAAFLEARSVSGSKKPVSKRKTILFITSCPEIWGGSEELWGGAALRLRERGHRVIVGRSEPRPRFRSHAKWRLLRDRGVETTGFSVPAMFRAVPDAFERYIPCLAPLFYGLRDRILSLRIRQLGVDFVVISQGNTFDGMEWVELPRLARLARKPYVLICQKNADLEWPFDCLRIRNKEHFRLAKRVFFVSRHNLELAEHMLGIRLDFAEVVRNPFMISTLTPLPWPEPTDGVFRLACVGRLWPKEKGQDILLRVMAQPKWRDRPLKLDFFGEGVVGEGLAGMAEKLGLESVRFCGFAADITEVWKTHHALALSSRAEGLPLAQVEAMICGRPPVITPAGGAPEIMEDGISGFLAASASEDAFDAALERAWQRRHEWREIGLRASEAVWRHFPKDPCMDFANKLESLMP